MCVCVHVSKLNLLYRLLISFSLSSRKGDVVLMNQSSGYLLRTKPANEDEGGVSVGVASLNTVSLVSEEEYLQTIVT